MYIRYQRSFPKLPWSLRWVYRSSLNTTLWNVIIQIKLCGFIFYFSTSLFVKDPFQLGLFVNVNLVFPEHMNFYYTCVLESTWVCGIRASPTVKLTIHIQERIFISILLLRGVLTGHDGGRYKDGHELREDPTSTPFGLAFAGSEQALAVLKGGEVSVQEQDQVEQNFLFCNSQAISSRRGAFVCWSQAWADGNFERHLFSSCLHPTPWKLEYMWVSMWVNIKNSTHLGF